MTLLASILRPPLLPALAALVLEGGAPPHLAEARSLLEGGKASEALAKAKEGLEHAPELPELLDLASRAAAESGAADQALWYGALALEQLSGIAAPSKAEKAIADAASKRMAELDPLQQKGPATLSGYASAILAIGKECASRKLYVNAVDLLGRCRGTPAAATAEAELGKIYGNKKAVEALLDSGLDVPVQPKKKRSPESIAREDAKHSSWETAWEIKGKQYTIKTDMGQEIAESMSLAMEQMNKFYRKVFHVKEFGGGETARLTIRVYKSRAEFDEGESKELGRQIDKGVKGHIVYSLSYVATYDPRDEGRSLSALWSTLFHESSHQFTRMISADLIPAWLNEGTASYFEGARLCASGIVETNLVPEGRLSSLDAMLKRSESGESTGVAKPAAGVPTLEEVVTYFKPGSYPGEYYPFGWGLVYFFLNYEDESSRRVYAQPYYDFTAAYKSGGKHDVKGRFVEHFVTKAKQPGIASFEDFERRWREWIHKLHALYFGEPAVADELIARARKQLADKALDSAAESFAWALRKRPGDAVASFELAELLASRKLSDAAIYRYRGAVASLRAMEDPSDPVPAAQDLTGTDLLELSEKQIAKLDKALCEQKAKADAGFVANVAEAAREYAEAEKPLYALRLLDVAQAAYGPGSTLAELRAEIAEKSGADTRRWRRPPVDDELGAWEAGSAWKAKEGALSGHAESLEFCTWRGELPERYTLEARLDASGLGEEDGVVGIVFGDNPGGLQFVGFFAGGNSVVGRFGEEGQQPLGALPSIKKDKLGSFTVTIEIHPEQAEFFVDGKSAGKPRAYKPGELAGRIGFVVQAGTAAISDVRVRY